MPEEQHPPMHFFTYSTKELVSPLQRVSVSEFNEGIPALLKRKQYKEISTRGPEYIKVYGSTLTVDRYLIIVVIEAYTFVFYVPSDQDLLAWRREYEQIPVLFLAQKWLPPARSIPEMQTFPMNRNALRGR